RSAWLQDSLRAGIALGAAVLIADLASLDHASWVVLGTLAVLRSSAFETGRTALNAATGTVLGFVVSTAFFAVVGLDRPARRILVHSPRRRRSRTHRPSSPRRASGIPARLTGARRARGRHRRDRQYVGPPGDRARASRADRGTAAPSERCRERDRGHRGRRD